MSPQSLPKTICQSYALEALRLRPFGSLNLEVPRDRDGTFQTDLFQRYQRSEKALVTTLMQMVIEGVSTRRIKDITTELCGREFSRQTVSNLTEKLDEQVQTWAERPLEEEYPSLLANAMRINVRRQGPSARRRS